MPYFPSPGVSAVATSGTIATSNTTASTSTVTGALKSGGGLGVVGATYIGGGLDLTVGDPDNALHALFHGTSKAIRFKLSTTTALIEGTDQTGLGSFQPLTLGGSVVAISSAVPFRVGNAATTGLTAGVLAALTNATIVISDSAGQAYRIPCII